MIRKFLLCIFILLTFFLLKTSQSYAQKEFSTDYNVSYSVLPDSTTNVLIKATLTNLTSNYYAALYKIKLAFNDIKNLNVSDEAGPISPTVIEGGSGTELSIKFNTNALGNGTKKTFSISFNTREVADRRGKILEVNTPGIDSTNVQSFVTTIILPKGSGNPSYVKPEVNYERLPNDTYVFNGSQLGKSGVSMGFGENQVYNFDLIYHLENSNLFPTFEEIALPPDTSYQKVLIASMNPKPENVRIDEDGNWMAKYNLSPKSKIDIEARGQVHLRLSSKQDNLTKAAIKKYTSATRFWQSDSKVIKDLAVKLKTPREIYDYVVTNLSYDYSRIGKNQTRLGAVKVLENPSSAVCLEFTDLFIALARASGIPARELNGYAYTKNESNRPIPKIQDILHSWPEYYDSEKKEWIMIDPTWENTTKGVDYFDKLDFDHVVLTIHGKRSDFPVPAGGYKASESKDSKDVDFVPSTKPISSKIKTRIKIDFPNTIYSGIREEGTINFENVGNESSIPQIIKLTTEKLSPNVKSYRIPSIPPFGKVVIPITFKNSGFLTKTTDNIKITSQSEVLVKSINILPFFLSWRILLGGVLFVLFILIISLITIGSRRIYIS